MKTVILCGGKGTRISEETIKIPKPMVKIGSKPILEHIMNYYSKYNSNHFILALGYKKQKIIKYFNTNKFKKKWKIEFINTGQNTLTGSRLHQLKKKFKKNENFFFTYGDGLSNINLNKLLNFHTKSKKISTVSIVRPVSRFGEIIVKKNLVNSFKEKPQMSNCWINGGYFVLNSSIFKFLPNKNHMFEREPLQKLIKKKELNAFKHFGKWQCMDTMRDKILLNKMLAQKKEFWK